MPRVGLTTAGVVDAALAVIDEQGPQALTLAVVAARTGVAAPSLYKHVGGLTALRTLVGERVLREMTAVFTAASLGRSGDDAVTAVLWAYRRWVLDHPARYVMLPLDPLHEPTLADAGRELLAVLLAVLRSYRLTDSAAVHALRRMRAVAHGFASLEAGGGFGLPEDLDETWEQLVALVLAGLPRP